MIRYIEEIILLDEQALQGYFVCNTLHFLTNIERFLCNQL